MPGGSSLTCGIRSLVQKLLDECAIVVDLLGDVFACTQQPEDLTAHNRICHNASQRSVYSSRCAWIVASGVAASRSRIGYVRRSKPIGVPANPQHSWFKSRRAITASTYEDDLVNRLHREADRIVPWFVEAYAVACVDAHVIGAQPALDCVFMMVTGGRVVVRGAGMSAMAAAVRPLRDQPNAAANSRALRKFLQSRRPVSVYERYLLESARHIEMSAPNLAVVQGVMILEWFVNEVIVDRLLRPLAKKIGDNAVSELVAARLADRSVRLSDKLRRYMPTLGLTLSAVLQKDVLGVIELRNRIVHQRQTDPIAREVADGSMRTLMAVVRAYMDQLSRFLTGV